MTAVGQGSREVAVEAGPSPTAQFRSRLLAREPLLGVFVKTPHPAVIEVLAGAGLDCVCLDAEHAPFDRGDLDRCILAGRAHGLPALVRTPSNEPHQILNALDLGAAGVVVPHVRTGEEARAVAKAARYGAGGRGYAGATRASAFSSPPISARLLQADAETTVIVQVEDLEALAEVEAIAGAPGVDAVFIGRIDLTVALGEVDPMAPRVLTTVYDICARALGFDCAVGLFTPDLREVADWRARGASLFLLGSDQGFLKVGAQRLRAETGL